MYGFLSTLLLAGSAVAAPLNAPRKDSCVDKSQAVNLWEVEGFDYHASYVFSSPSHQNSWGYVNFTLANPAVPYKPVCSAQSNQLEEFFYGTVVYDCDVPDDAGGESTFTFSRPSGELRINQTWACAGEGARFDAEGGVNLDLDCKTTKWKNPDWQPGDGIYSSRKVDCNLVDAQAPIDQISGVRRK